MPNKEKWVVCGDTPYYPWVDEYDSFEKAKIAYDDAKPWKKENVYLCKVIEHKGVYS